MKRELLLRNRLKEARKEKGMSQEELAKKVGVARNTITSIERYEYTPTAYLAYLLCHALGWTFEEMFYMEKIER